MRSTLVILAVISLCGCASELLSTGNIRDKTAAALGQPPASITITNRRADGAATTYYMARTPTGAYSCVVNGGSFMSLGLSDAPSCTPSGPRKTPRS